MGDLNNTNGPGPTGTPTNSPISDGGTMQRTQNRPNVSHGAGPGQPGSSAPAPFQFGLTDADRRFIRDIHRDRPLPLERLVALRFESLRLQEEALRNFGPESSTVLWLRQVIAAYDEEIAKAKSPMGSAINALKTVLADPKASEKEISQKIGDVVGIMRQKQLMGAEDDPSYQEATPLIEQAVDRSAEQRTSALEDLVKRETGASGSVSDDKFKEALAAAMGVERQRQLMGMADDDEGAKKSDRVSQAVVEVVHLVSERRIDSLKALIDQEKKSMGSIPDQKFKELVAGVLGDERQKQLMGISDDKTGGAEAVVDVMGLIIKRRQAAVSDLLKKQSQPGSGVTNAQINQAIKDFDEIRSQARRFGMSVPEGFVTLGTPDVEKQ